MMLACLPVYLRTGGKFLIRCHHGSEGAGRAREKACHKSSRTLVSLGFLPVSKRKRGESGQDDSDKSAAFSSSPETRPTDAAANDDLRGPSDEAGIDGGNSGVDGSGVGLLAAAGSSTG